MSKLNHPNIVKLHGLSLEPHVRMVLEFCPLPDLYKTNKSREKGVVKFSEKLKLKLGLDICSALSFLQGISPPIVHRDLRSPNIFVTSLDENSTCNAKVGGKNFSFFVKNFSFFKFSSFLTKQILDLQDPSAKN